MKRFFWLSLLITLLFINTSKAHAAASLVQNTYAHSYSSSISTSFASTNTAGNFIIATVFSLSTSTNTSVIDSQGNVYALAYTFTDAPSTVVESVFYAPNIKAGANTVTASAPGNTNGNLFISEWSGLAWISPVDSASGAKGYSTTPSTSFTTAADGDLIYGFGYIGSGAGTTGTGFSPIDFASANYYVDEYQNQSSAGNIAASWVNGSTSGWDVAAVAFKGSSTPDTTPPVLSAIASSTTQTSATITWTTDEAAISKVVYGTTTAYGSATSSATLATSHSLTLASLLSGTLYHFAVVSADASGNTATSSDYTFTTAIPDTTAPSTPTNLTATATSSSEIDLSWSASTDNVGVTGYKVYRGGTQIATTTSTVYSDTGLTASTTYSYTVAAFDASGNVSAQSSSASATTQGVGSYPLGWTELPNTKITDVCPPVGFGGAVDPNGDGQPYPFPCAYVIAAYSGAIADTARNRMIIWGGGHADYYGNELYSLNLGSTTPTLTRLTDPSVPLIPNSSTTPSSVMPDGRPTSRHNFDSLVYLPNADRMFVYGGALATGNGPAAKDTWTLDLGNITNTGTSGWYDMDPVNGTQRPSDSYGTVDNVAAYDPNTGLVFLSNLSALWKYDYNSNTYTLLNSNAALPLYTDAVVDPVRKLLIFIGGAYQSTAPHMEVVDISATSSYALQDWSSLVTGCDALDSSSYPGLAYDPVLDRIVGWPDAGNTVYLFDPATKTCTTQTYPNGPTNTAPYGNGTFGHFQYFPSLDAFALIINPDVNQNAFLLRLSASSTPDTTPPVLSSIGSSTTATAATITWTTDEAATSKVVYGTTSAYGSATSSATLATSHSLTLPSLAAGTLYHFAVVSADASGNTATSSDYTFTTASVPAPAISSFFASPTSITSGNSSTLSWTTTGATTVSIDQGVGSQSATSSGSVSVSPTVTTTYTLTAANGNGTTTAQATVTVSAPDTTAPSTPTGLSASAVSSSQINLSWTASTDNVGVTGYKIYRGGTQSATTTGTVYSDTGLSASTTYSYTVAAYDAAGNVSAQSASASATTQAASSGGSSGGGSSGGGSSSSSSSGGSSSGTSGGGVSQVVVSTSTLPLVSAVSTTAPIAPFASDLKPGMHSADVARLQTVLMNLGFLASGNDTGYYGPLTTAAVQAFQKAHGIVTSGTPGSTGYGAVGPTTRAALNTLRAPSSVSSTPEGAANGQSAIDYLKQEIARLLALVASLTAQLNAAMPHAPSSAATPPAAELSSDLSQGSSGSEVTLLQKFLASRTYLSPDNLTGYYGPLTKAAVESFQSDYSLAASGTPSAAEYGMVGPNTRYMINMIIGMMLVPLR